MKDNSIYSLKDFELSTKMEARVRAEENLKSYSFLLNLYYSIRIESVDTAFTVV